MVRCAFSHFVRTVTIVATQDALRRVASHRRNADLEPAQLVVA
jgi:hypothetical protein